jgi:hypothetical protein
MSSVLSSVVNDAWILIPAPCALSLKVMRFSAGGEVGKKARIAAIERIAWEIIAGGEAPH